VYEKLSLLALLGFVPLVCSFVWVSTSTNKEGVHRSYCVETVINHVISRWLKGSKS
jgi:hypothetical protein